MLEGLDSKNSLIMPFLASISQVNKKTSKKPSWNDKTISFFLFFSFLKSITDLIILFTFNIKYVIIQNGLNKMLIQPKKNKKKEGAYGNIKFQKN